MKADYRAEELIRQGNALFERRTHMMNYWQEAAENFYPERADFTRPLDIGEDFAAHLTSSIPVLNRRELGDMFSAMLRPWNIEWFEITADDGEVPHDAKLWLQHKQATQRNAMQDAVAGFDRAAKLTDHDYVTFGQGVLKIEINYRDQALLVRNRHLRDVAWCDDFTGRTYKVHEKMRMTAYQICQQFPENKLHPDILKAKAKEPQREFELRQVVLPVDAYESIRKSGPAKSRFFKTKFVSIIVDVENMHIIEESPSVTLKYAIPRWQPLSGSQYSFSPATVAALPEARLFQSVTLSLLEAGEHYARPPLFVVDEALRGDLNYFAGGVTNIAKEFAEKNMDPFRFMQTPRGGMPFALEMLDRVRGVLRESWYLNRMRLPERGAEMTAFEFSERMREYVRDSLTLFTPAETEYNAPVCEMIFEEMLAYGFMGRPDEVPDALASQEIRFRFRSPFRDAQHRQSTGAFMEGLDVIERTSMFDQDAGHLADLRKGLKKSLEGIDWPADWFFSPEELEERMAAIAEKRELAEGAAFAEQAGGALKEMGQGGKAMKEVMA